MRYSTQIQRGESIDVRRVQTWVPLARVLTGSLALLLGLAHPHDFKKGDLVIDSTYAKPSLAATAQRQRLLQRPEQPGI